MNEDVPEPGIEVICQAEDIGTDVDKLIKHAKYVCSCFKIDNASVSITFVDDEGIVEVNKQYLNSSSVTDVISFDLSDDIEDVRVFELVINTDEARRQAQERGHTFEAELALYVTHGLLHNMGFDDGDESDSIKMHEMEDKILQQAGYGIVYGK